MKYLALMVMLAAPAHAQHFDLSEIPDGYRFTSNENDGHAVVTYLGVEDGVYLFQYVTDDGINPVRTTLSRANRASQLVEFSNGQDSAVLTPHDCWPQKGRCKYVVTYKDGISVRVTSETYVEHGVWFHRRFVEDNTGWYEIERGCATIDDYGFPIDLYIDYGGGRIEWSTRETTQGLPDPRADFETLKAICESTEDLSS